MTSSGNAVMVSGLVSTLSSPKQLLIKRLGMSLNDKIALAATPVVRFHQIVLWQVEAFEGYCKSS